MKRGVIVLSVVISFLVLAICGTSTMAQESATKYGEEGPGQGNTAVGERKGARIECSLDKEGNVLSVEKETEERVAALLDEYELEGEEEQCKTLIEISREVNLIVFVGGNVGKDLRDRLSAKLIHEFQKAKGKGELAQCKRTCIVEILARGGNDKEGRSFVLEIIDKGPEDLRLIALDYARPSVLGDGLYERYNKLERSGKITKKQRLLYSFRLDKRGMRPELEKVIQESPDEELFIYACLLMNEYEDQGQSPGNLRIVFRRIREFGLDNTKRWKHNKLFWLDGKRCAKYLESVESEELVNAVEIMDKAGVILDAFPVVIKRGLIGHPDIRIRRVFLHWIGPAVSTNKIEANVARDIVRERLREEEDPDIGRSLRITLRELE